MIFTEQDILRTLMKWRYRITAAAWVVVRDAQAPEDIFQNVVLKAMTKEVTFEAEGAVLSWAFITARREGLDWLRRHRKESPGLDTEILELLEHEWLSDAAHHGDIRMKALRECLKALPGKSSWTLRLRYFEGYSCKEVAEKLGTGINAIYKRLSRLHHGLKECIELRLDESKETKS